VRADIAFGEQILDIADDSTNDWIEAKNGGAPRSTRSWSFAPSSASRLGSFICPASTSRPGARSRTIDIKNDWALLSEEERRRKADELIAMIRELREPPMQPPPLVYRWEEAPEKPELVGIGSQTRPAAGRNR
jgi:hypothetical protein